jgi:hypothetical protein
MRTTIVAGLLAAAMLALGASAAGAAVSGVEQYTVRGPSANGNDNTAKAPTPHPDSLSPQAKQALADQPDAAELTTIATAPELGAPVRTHAKKAPAVLASAEVPSADAVPSASDAASSALGGTGWVAVIAAIALAVGVTVAARRRVRRI